MGVMSCLIQITKNKILFSNLKKQSNSVLPRISRQHGSSIVTLTNTKMTHPFLCSELPISCSQQGIQVNTPTHTCFSSFDSLHFYTHSDFIESSVFFFFLHLCFSPFFSPLSLCLFFSPSLAGSRTGCRV